MIGTIRKHSTWLWGIIIIATIVTFVFWGMGPTLSGGGRMGNFGSIAGQKITQEAYEQAKNEVYIYHWLTYHRWPDRDPDYSKTQLVRDIYVRLMLIQKAKALGIHVGSDVVATVAQDILSSPVLTRAFGFEGRSVPLDVFVSNVLQQRGLTAKDFEDLIRHDLMLDQLRQAMGLAGQLVTPQEAAAIYERQNQRLSAQAVFFSASNYLAAVRITPAVVAQFYTNYLAEYRLPDRVQVSYVAFAVTNFTAEVERKMTNLNDQVKEIYNHYGTNAVAGVKTPEEAKQKIREILVRRQALVDARQQSDGFATKVFNMDPVRPENLATVAKKEGLAVHVTAPFSKEYGPETFNAPADFIKEAFSLTPDEPLAGPIVGQDAVYVIAFDKQLPSEIPPLDHIRARVTHDYQFHEATLRAQQAGTNCVHTLLSGLAEGKSFSTACAAAGLHPEALPPFSLRTRDLPELGGRVSLNRLKQVAFTTPVGHLSRFEPTDNGGFIIYVKSHLPIDKAVMTADLPQFTAALRQQNETEVFDNWIDRTGSRDLLNTPIAPRHSETAAP